ncbi:hypothetical protein KN1_13030 [Stygiolobus caldivivus]|uniref:Uncharacterized protein n=1 Tax=Stygiolobus caldivivus TaxID=2824673 RepID=A0A8D5ZIW6_9CREN|nr:hypothetical protein KN1_13030 [Stygiolobus caldivivus]
MFFKVIITHIIFYEFNINLDRKSDRINGYSHKWMVPCAQGVFSNSHQIR